MRTLPQTINHHTLHPGMAQLVLRLALASAETKNIC